MDQLNFRNMLLAYHAVHDEVLCESMDELGFFDESSTLPQMKSKKASVNLESKNEEYELYELVLEHLLDEGYTDSIEGAVAILENMSDEWLEEIIEAREEGVKPYRPNPTQAEIRERQRKGKPKDDRPGWKDRSHIKSEGPLITAHPGKADEAKETLRKTLPDGGRIMAPGFFPSRTADRVAAITSSFTRGESPGGGDPQATRMPGERKPRRVIPAPDRSSREPKPTPRKVIPSRLDKKR